MYNIVQLLFWYAVAIYYTCILFGASKSQAMFFKVNKHRVIQVGGKVGGGAWYIQTPIQPLTHLVTMSGEANN